MENAHDNLRDAMKKDSRAIIRPPQMPIPGAKVLDYCKAIYIAIAYVTFYFILFDTNSNAYHVD